ncbi:hypothetical protein NPIL_303901 [Nephila pilipes]|uniref:Uncharacterized protein n=1 Tax=Nephila pilipes TaxID=299642 RepID=A0A8X6N909_NEPPI|nr:hypothetical protein NPIL_303901 [Nephila pilipes]
MIIDGRPQSIKGGCPVNTSDFKVLWKRVKMVIILLDMHLPSLNLRESFYFGNWGNQLWSGALRMDFVLGSFHSSSFELSAKAICQAWSEFNFVHEFK